MAMFFPCGFAASCKKYAVPVNATPSGKGKLWEYYHLMVDFAPAIYHHMRNDSDYCKHLYVPGWYGDAKFLLTNPNYSQRTMQPHFDYFLGGPLNISLIAIANMTDMEGLIANADVNVIPWNCRANGTQWANQSDVYFNEFRTHALTLVGNQRAPWSDAVVVRRNNISNYSGPKMGAGRRHLSKDFFGQIQADMRHGTNTTISVVSLENATAEQQIKLFSNTAAVIAVHGAALSNILFSPPGTLVVELGRRRFLCYARLAKKLQLPYVYHNTPTYTKATGTALKRHLGTRYPNVFPQYINFTSSAKKKRGPPKKKKVPPVAEKGPPKKKKVPPVAEKGPPTKKKVPPVADNGSSAKKRGPPKKRKVPPFADSESSEKKMGPPKKKKGPPFADR